MGRPPLDPGQHGKISVREIEHGAWVARCRYRDPAGATKVMERRRGTEKAAIKAVQQGFRDEHELTADDLKPYHRLTQLAEVWVKRMEARVADGAVEDTTLDRYQHRLERIILPGLGQFQLRELTPGRVDSFFADLAPRYSPETRKGVRAVMSGVMKLALRQGAVALNPVDSVEDIRSAAKQPRALTPDERRRWLGWLDGVDTPAQRAARRRDLPDLVRMMLGTGVRLGEALAVRWVDVDLVGVPVVEGDEIKSVPIVAITGNIVAVKGKGLVRHAGKSAKALRVVPLPRFVVDMLSLRQRDDDEEPVFPAHSRRFGISWKSPSNTGRWIREARAEVGLDWMTSHTWRKTAATMWFDAGVLTTRQIGDLTGHAKLSTLTDVYIARGELHPEGAAVMDAAWLDR